MQIGPSIYPLLGRPQVRSSPPAPATELDGLPLVLSLPDPVDVVTMSSLEGLLTGRTLMGRYEVGEVLGRGGMGIVYRARDRRLERDVALKVLTLASTDPEEHAALRARLSREARIAAGIRHANVVAIYDQATDEALGIDFLTMELLEGENLAERVRRLGLPRMGSAMHVLREAAAGVAAGHRAGLVHRDVKPANLFLETGAPGAPDRVRILDFGIAQGAVDVELPGSEGAAPVGLSPGFASPEQLRGGEWLTPASDVFSLGAVAFNLLTGRRAFRSTDGTATMREVEQAVADLQAEGELPPQLVRVLERAMAPFPEDRYADAGVLLRALEEVSTRQIDGWSAPDDRSRATPPPPPPAAMLAAEGTRSEEPDPRRHRAMTVLSTLLLLASWAFGAGGLIGPRGSVIVALALSAVILPLVVIRLRGDRGSPRFAILATLAVTLVGLLLVGGALTTLPAFVGISLAQLFMALGAAWLSTRPADVQDAEYEIVDPPHGAW